MRSRGRSPDPPGIIREMTVAHVRPGPGEVLVEVLFLESPRIYRLLAAHPDFDRLRALLHGAITTGRAVKVRLAALDGDVIQDARE